MTNKVQRTRLNRGMTVWGLAVLARMSNSTIVAVEKYGYVPLPHTQAKFAKALGVKCEDLFPIRDKGST